MRLLRGTLVKNKEIERFGSFDPSSSINTLSPNCAPNYIHLLFALWYLHKESTAEWCDGAAEGRETIRGLGDGD